MDFHIRAADASDAAAPSALAVRAKGHWGYPAEWLERWTADLTITPEYLIAHWPIVAVSTGVPVGVCVLEVRGDEASLEHVWIDPRYQGSGIGRALVGRALERAASTGAARVAVTSDPFAEAFYIKLGARRRGAVPAPMPGAPTRVLPLLEFILPDRPR
jgi:GNAT superfamily N-acetyltransferase